MALALSVNPKEASLIPDLLKVNTDAFLIAADWVSQTIERRVFEINNYEEPVAIDKVIESPPVWPKGSAWELIKIEYELSTLDMFLLSIVYVSQFAPDCIIELWKNTAFVGLVQDNGLYVEEGIPDDERFENEEEDEEEITYSFAVTLRAALFLLSGERAIDHAMYYLKLTQSRLLKDHIITTKDLDEAIEDRNLYLRHEYYRWLMTGQKTTIELSNDFPARLLETHLSFDDLVLKDSVLEQLNPLMDFVKYQDEIYSDPDFERKIKSGYISLLYGPPGTGKTLTVAVIGKTLGIDVYCVDLSRIVSKYIGETEKNLEKIFERLESKRCILLFDEADALFGKRSEVKSVNDKFANQEVAYLLQRIEKYRGLVLLTSNYNQNLDAAFKRRILTFIYMPPPNETDRKTLWEKAIPSNYSVQPEGLLDSLAEDYMLTGANIANVVKLSCIKSFSESNKNILTRSILESNIKLEQSKERN